MDIYEFNELIKIEVIDEAGSIGTHWTCYLNVDFKFSSTSKEKR